MLLFLLVVSFKIFVGQCNTYAERVIECLVMTWKKYSAVFAAVPIIYSSLTSSSEDQRLVEKVGPIDYLGRCFLVKKKRTYLFL